MKSAFATRLAGSADLYHTNQRKPYHSINFIIAHDGFTLADLVAYNEKPNGEQNSAWFGAVCGVVWRGVRVWICCSEGWLH